MGGGGNFLAVRCYHVFREYVYKFWTCYGSWTGVSPGLIASWKTLKFLYIFFQSGSLDKFGGVLDEL